MCCTPDSEAKLCTDEGAECGMLTITDNCGTSRTITSCGTCSGGLPCIDNKCCSPTMSAEDACVNAGFCGPNRMLDLGCGMVNVDCSPFTDLVCTDTNDVCNAAGDGCECVPRDATEACQAAGFCGGTQSLDDGCGNTMSYDCTGVSCTSGSCVTNAGANQNMCK